MSVYVPGKGGYVGPVRTVFDWLKLLEGEAPETRVLLASEQSNVKVASVYRCPPPNGPDIMIELDDVSPLGEIPDAS